jgi:hypothetical protein
MNDAADLVEYDITLPLSQPADITVSLPKGTLASAAISSILEEADGQLGSEWGSSPVETRWEDHAADDWLLRELRWLEEGRWWTEDEVETYRDRQHFRHANPVSLT